MIKYIFWAIVLLNYGIVGSAENSQAESSRFGDLHFFQSQPRRMKKAIMQYKKRAEKGESSAGARLDQLKANLNRVKKLEKDLGENYIVVNIPDFNLTIIESGKKKMTMKLIVGNPFHQTPTFSSQIKAFIINPTWNVPESIAMTDILPKIQEDPRYLLERRFSVFKGYSKNAPVINPKTVDWSEENSQNLKYRFRQPPGPTNPLGPVKFLLTDQRDIFLHGSCEEELFDEKVRNFSHGCVRVEDPVTLAQYLIQKNSLMPPPNMRELVSKGETKNFDLENPMPIHFLYLTAWVDSKGKVHFLEEDVYGKDRELK